MYQYTPGVDNQSAADAFSLIQSIPENRLPRGIESSIWSAQQAKYSFYWYFWRGQLFDESSGKDPETKKPIPLYPIKIGLLKQICRIHNSVLWGEVRDHTSLVKTRIKPRPDFLTGEISDPDKKLGATMGRLVSFVWEQSNGSATLWECGLMNQFLGGSYLQLVYDPEADTPVPLFVRSVRPDHVLPVPNPRDPWELLEAFIVYRINPASARALYGVESPKNASYVTYVEHWTKTSYSILIDGKPVSETKRVNGFDVQQTYDALPNPFGFVPLVYIPRTREGSFFGDAITGDISGLIAEYNSRMADAGDQVAQAADVEWFGKNLSKDPVPRRFGKGKMLSDLGTQNPATKGEPNVWAENMSPPTQPTLDFNTMILSQIDRESGVSPVAYGIDEGSQRSGTTLQIRMLPTISIARAQRTHWHTGLSVIERMILRALIRLRLLPSNIAFAENDIKRMVITHIWAAFIPRDEAEATNRIATLRPINAMSEHRSVEMQSDVDDVEEELERIESDRKKAQERIPNNGIPATQAPRFVSDTPPTEAPDS